MGEKGIQLYLNNNKKKKVARVLKKRLNIKMNFLMVRIMKSSMGYQEGLQLCGAFKNKSSEFICLELRTLSLSEASKRVGSKQATPTRWL